MDEVCIIIVVLLLLLMMLLFFSILLVLFTGVKYEDLVLDGAFFRGFVLCGTVYYFAIHI